MTKKIADHPMLRRGLSFLAWSSSAGLILAILVRLTVRDRFMVSQVIFYGTPWPVIAAGATVLAVWWLWHGRNRLSAIYALLAVAASGLWLALSWRWQPPPTAPGDVRVVLWNVSRPQRGLSPMARWLRNQNADVIALAEGHRRGTSNLADWQRELPGYMAMELPAEMTLFVRGKIVREEPHPVFTDLNYSLVRVEVRGQPLTILQIDINASIRRSRKQALGELMNLASPLRSENLIVLGDFNTPRESLLLDPLRANFTSAFETAGRGCAETWPVPLPVLALDQIWCSPGLTPIFCRAAYSLRTDHRALVADFRFAAKP
jgi:endonuclease/exonuclease/phosphatase (EEP) superfamily protein YafD